MYESEIYSNSIQEDIPEEILHKFHATYNTISKRSLLHWSEHCSECAMPDCFKTCDLYTPRVDLKCQRFVKGIERINTSSSNKIELLKIFFKKWAVLESQGSTRLFAKNSIRKIEKVDLTIAKLIDKVPLKFLKGKLASRRYNLKKRALINSNLKNAHIPDAFILEIFNPNEGDFHISITMRNEDLKFRKLPFQYRFQIKRGYNLERIPLIEIQKRINLNKDFRIDIYSEDLKPINPVYFGLKEFIKDNSSEIQNEPLNKVKCLIWDLDNTVWDGTILEQNLNEIQIKNGLISVLKEMEDRGIVNAIASKNNKEEGLKALKHFGIEKFFLFPKISWNPKSQSVLEIASEMNISLDNLAFIDDSKFELEEVKMNFPQVRTYDASQYLSLTQFPEFKADLNTLGNKRKSYYQNESRRKSTFQSFGDNYISFLKHCDIKLSIHPLDAKYFERVYELTQRTNQMNFSGRRYQKNDIEELLNEKHLDSYVLDCEDKFGKYGIIGFAIIDSASNTIKDLMFSCRIQSKRIEHAFLSFCLKKYLGEKDFHVEFLKTDRNKFSAQVFEDLNFETLKITGSKHHLIFKKSKAIPEEKIIKVSYFEAK